MHIQSINANEIATDLKIIMHCVVKRFSIFYFCLRFISFMGNDSSIKKFEMESIVGTY